MTFVLLFYHFKYVWYVDVNLCMIILNLGESVGRLCTREQWCALGFLAQASMARLGEINRGSPKMFHASGRSGDPRCSRASEHLAQARGVSPKRDPT